MHLRIGALFFLLLWLATVQAATVSPWQQALASRDLDRISRLLEQGADPNVGAGDGVTALMLAARHARLPLMRRLLQAGANVNATNDRGGSALMYAVISADPQASELLLDHGADPNQRASNGWSALTIASAKGYAPIARGLLKAGADPNIQDIYGWTALMRAVHTGRPAIVKLLLRQESTAVNLQNDNGSTALHIAAARGERELCRLLLARGADLHIENRAGYTPESMAARAGYHDLAQYLEQRSAG